MKRTLSNKTNFSVLKISGFRSRMSTVNGKNILNKRRRKSRKNITI